MIRTLCPFYFYLPNVCKFPSLLPMSQLIQLAKVTTTLPCQIIQTTGFIVHDVAFGNMLNGRLIVMDAEEGHAARPQYKGMLNTSLIAGVTVARTRPEIYVYESFYSRGTTRTRRLMCLPSGIKLLCPLRAEIVIPGAKRAGQLPSDYLGHIN